MSDANQTGCCGMCQGWFPLDDKMMLPTHGPTDNPCFGSGSFPIQTQAMVQPYTGLDTDDN